MRKDGGVERIKSQQIIAPLEKSLILTENQILAELISDDEDGDIELETISPGNEKDVASIDIQKYLMQIPPDFEKAEIHGVSTTSWVLLNL